MMLCHNTNVHSVRREALCGSATPCCPPTRQAVWSVLVCAAELKACIITEGPLHDALGQLVLRCQECFRQQPPRQAFYGCVADATHIEFFYFLRGQDTCFISSGKRSGLESLYIGSDASVGLKLLVALMYAAPETLGFKADDHPVMWVKCGHISDGADGRGQAGVTVSKRCVAPA